MEDRWHEVWNRRNANASMALDLNDLIALDGFDSGAGKIEIDDWRKYASRVSDKLRLKDGNSVSEVGCGSGAFLYALRERHKLKVGRNDYGLGLIETALRVFPNEDFQCIEASKINLQAPYDVVVSNSVFHYFDQTYARKVIDNMMQKATSAVCIFEVPDIETRDQVEKLRREMLTAEEYEKKYAGLSHTYYSSDWFSEIAKENGVKYEIFDGLIPNYAQNQFRFGCIVYK